MTPSRDAADYGFSTEATGLQNRDALQRAVDGGGTIRVTRPGTYPIAGTVYLGSDTALCFDHGVALKKVAEAGPFSHVFLNKGARTRTYDHRITIEGLHLIVNGVDHRTFVDVFGLHGQVAFFYVRELTIRDLRCFDLGKLQYCIHVCTFEDVLVERVRVEGLKDGVHLGRGRRFTIRDGVFRTYDDAIALNAHDYDVGNPELGWIEQGVVENCHDLPAAEGTTGYFCRLLVGGWREWFDGMEVQKSDTVISGGKLYRVRAEPDGKTYRSATRPTHARGAQVLDGIRWEHVQDEPVETAGVRDVVFRDLFLSKPRTSFSIHFDNDRYSRGYTPGSPVPAQRNVVIENAVVLHDEQRPFIHVAAPVDAIHLSRCRLRDTPITFGRRIEADFGPTAITMTACTFERGDARSLVRNEVPGKQVDLLTSQDVPLPSQA